MIKFHSCELRSLLPSDLRNRPVGLDLLYLFLTCKCEPAIFLWNRGSCRYYCTSSLLVVGPENCTETLTPPPLDDRGALLIPCSGDLVLLGDRPDIVRV